jgi:Flp pilus assembly protein TadG
MQTTGLPKRKRPLAGLRKFTHFLRNRSGNVAMMFGLAAIPFFTMGGMAVDFSRAMMVKNRLGTALDATALALGSQLGLNQQQVRAQAQAYFDANYPASELGTPSALNINYGATTVTLSATATVPTMVIGLVGVNELDVQQSVEVTREMKGLEVALVLDTTGSMDESGKMPALKAAAHELIDILFGDQTTSTQLRMAIVPFAAAVRLDDPASAINRGWIDTTGTSTWARLNFNNNRFAHALYPPIDGSTPAAYQMHRNQRWRGCVEARASGYEATDTAPNAGTPDTRWVPFLAPDEPDSGSGTSGWANRYVDDGTTSSSWQTRLQNSTKYAGLNNSAIHAQCAMQPILPLTGTRALITARIDSLNPAGHTHIPIGLGWGWRVLSPGEPYTQGRPYNDPDFSKALILMTDGVNTIPTNSSPAGSAYTAYGYLYQARLGSTNGGTANTNMNTQTATQCTAIKNAGIRVYTILFMENDNTVRNLLRTCATDPSLFYDTPTTAQLRTVFRLIASDLSNLRVSR